MLKFKGNDWSETQQELVTQDPLPEILSSLKVKGKNCQVRAMLFAYGFVKWNRVLPLGWGKNTKFILSRASNASCLTWNPILRPNLLHPWDSADTNPSQNTGHQKSHPPIKTNSQPSLWWVIWKDGIRSLIFLVGEKVVPKLWFEICHFMNLKSVSSFRWKRKLETLMWYKPLLVLEILDFLKFFVLTRGKKKLWDYFSVTQLANFSLQTF